MLLITSCYPPSVVVDRLENDNYYAGNIKLKVNEGVEIQIGDTLLLQNGLNYYNYSAYLRQLTSIEL